MVNVESEDTKMHNDPSVTASKRNYLILLRLLLEVFTPILRTHLQRYILPSKIFNTIENDREFNRLIKGNQRQTLKNAKTNGYEKFDISLLYLIFRNFCEGLQPPKGGWDLKDIPPTRRATYSFKKFPDQNDLGEAADIERIHIIRNELSHTSEIDHNTFIEWQDILYNVCLRMSKLHDVDEQYKESFNYLVTTPWQGELYGIYSLVTQLAETIQSHRDSIQMLEENSQSHEETAEKQIDLHASQEKLDDLMKSVDYQTKMTTQRGRDPNMKKEIRRMKLKHYIIHFALVCIIVLLCAYFMAQGTKDNELEETLGSNPSEWNSLLEQSQKNQWGSFTPSSAFEFTTRMKKSPMFRLIWLEETKKSSFAYEHCEWRLKNIQWEMHDGKHFGHQSLRGQMSTMKTTFLIDQNDPDVSELRIEQRTDSELRKLHIALMFSSKAGTVKLERATKTLHYIKIIERDGAQYFISVRSYACDMEFFKINTYSRVNQHRLIFEKVTKIRNNRSMPNQTNTCILICEIAETKELASISIRIASNSYELPKTREMFLAEVEERKQNFLTRFENVFSIQNYAGVQQAKEAAINILSNLLGSIGSFSGSMDVLDPYSGRAFSKEIKTILTTTPSRIFHSHGHLWDEGFHNMVLVLWNFDLSFELLLNWLDLMDKNGWIPREIIIDEYSKSNVPKHFHLQITDNANPPTFLYPLLHIVDRLASDGGTNSVIVTEIFKKVAGWFDWFEKSQAGFQYSSYRWRSRSLLMNENQTNKMTIASGIDDYPRAKIVDEYERHLDLRCWIAFAANATARLADLASKDSSRYNALFRTLSDETLLDSLHWDNMTKQYGDFGADSKEGKSPTELLYKVINRKGYISIFPFLLKLLQPESEKLKYIIDDIKNPDILWTDYGLRSLSKHDDHYRKKNSIYDEPQWRGSIRLNINYLALGALKYYATFSKKYNPEMQSLYWKLRENVLRNVVKVYFSQGNFYEKYNDVTGAGEGHYPHSGASVIILILSEKYF